MCSTATRFTSLGQRENGKTSNQTRRMFGAGALCVLMASMLAPTTAWAGAEDNIRADLLSVEESGGQVIATLDYSILDLPPLNNINAYTIEVGLDRNNDQTIDTLLWSFAGATSGTVLQPSHTVSQDIRPALDALAAANRVQDGDRVIANLDTTNSNPNELAGLGEGDNFAAATPFYVDIEPKSLVLDAANVATLTFLVNSPARIRGTTVEFWRDDNNSNAIDGGDTLVGSFNVNGNPGIRVTTQDFSAFVPDSGQRIFARVDADAEVDEAAEGNNTISTINSSATDLIAISLAYDVGLQEATLSYLVQAPADVDPFIIEFILDDGDMTPGPGDTIVGSIAGDVTPGAHVTAPFSFAGNAPAAGQFIFAYIDQPGSGGNPPLTGAVVESDETANNWMGSSSTFATDIVALSMTYDPVARIATLVYVVNSPTPVDPFGIRFSLDRNNNGGPGGDAPPVAVIAGNTAPGAHVVTQSFAAPGDSPASNQLIYALLDNSGQVAEDDEGNNRADAYNTVPTDLVALSLSYDPNTQTATLSYAVDAPIDVPAYDIEFILDDDGSGTPTLGDILVASVPGQVAPGHYVLPQSFAANPADSGQFLFAWIDRQPAPGGDVAETIEIANNRVAAVNTETTDLDAVSLSYDPNTQDATLTYVVTSPIDVPAYDIELYLDDNPANGLLDPTDTLVDTISGAVSAGAYVEVVSFAANPPASNQMVFASIDLPAPGSVTETDESGNNTVSAINTSPTDLVANLIGSLTYDANFQIAVLTYEVVSPIDVEPYFITFIRDTNGDLSPNVGDTVAGIQAGDTSPGLHSTSQSFGGAPVGSGQALFALVDYPPALGGNVIEIDENNNAAVTINTEQTDLVVQSLAYDANTRVATLDYVVFAPINVSGNAIQFYLETNGTAGLQTGGGGDQIVAVVLGDVTPGAHTATASYNLAPPATGQFLYATIDTANQVIETDENNNLGITFNTTPTDLVAVSLAYDSNTQEATLSYVVSSPIDVPAYSIEFFLDRNNSGLLDAGDGPRVALQAGQVAPGAYAATASFAGEIPATHQFLFAVLDRLPAPPGNVAESDESYTSNVATTSNSLGTDLVAGGVQVVVDNTANATRARVYYTVYGPLPVAPFSLKVGIDRDANGTIDGGGSDVLADILVNNLVDRAPGVHMIETPNFRPALNGLPLTLRLQYGAQIVATVDLNQDGSPAGAVIETEEQTNNKSATTPIVDLVANSVTVFTDPSANSTKARIAYTVDSPGAVEEFTIRVGVDRNGDDVIDSLGDVLDTILVTDAPKLRPGARTETSANFRAALNAVTPALKNGDRIIATLDLLQNNLPVNDVTERDEAGNNIVKQAQKVDLVAISISVNVDLLGGTTEADVSYHVDSPGSSAAFSLKVGLDRDGDGNIDDPDGLLSDQLLGGADVTPGPHTVTVAGLRAALAGLATPIKNGDAIVATLDLLLDGTDAGAVVEDIETTNNATGQIQTVDLVANAVALSSDDIAGTTTAEIAYTINSPGAIAAFDIRLGVDRDGNNIIDADPSDLLLTLAAPDLTPGSHTAAAADIRGALEALVTRLADGDRILATLDLDQAGAPANQIVEAEEINNNFASQAQNVDLVLTELNLFTTANGQRKARISYTVNSPGTTATFNIRLGLDADNNSVLDPGSVMRLYDLEPDLGVAMLRPGEHQVTTDDLTADLNALALQNGQRIIATLDLADVDPYDLGIENTVLEAEELVNNRARQPLNIDLVAISLAYDSNTNLATLSYSVNSFGGVPAYDIEFFLDDNPENSLWDATDTLVATVPGGLLPGAYTAVGDFTATQVNSQQYVFAVIDRAAAVVESDEANNLTGTNNTEITDLVANSITIVSDDIAHDTTATVAYTIVAPDPFAVPAFDVLIGVDRDGDGLIDSAADVLAAIPAPDLTPGAHSVTSADLRAALEALADRLDNGDRIVAMLDLTWDGLPVNQVVEIGGDEVANNVASQTMMVDLIAAAVEVYQLPGSGNRVARVSYTVGSVGAANPFFIRVGVDRDGDKIIDADSLLATIDVLAEGVQKLRPGNRDVSTGDLTAALNALLVPLQNGDRIIATLDILDDGLGTPENLVGEAEEQTNNFTREPVTVDLVAQSIFLTVDNDAGTTAATVTYTVNSIGATAGFELRIGIDRDADNLVDAGAGDLLFQASLSGGDVLPGPHDYVVPDIRPAINALSPPIAYGDRIIATLDLDLAGADEAAVDEVEETGNNVTTVAGSQAQIIDLAADELNLNVGSFVATVNYTVTSPGNVAPFRIYIGRDTDNDNVIDDLLVDLAGDPTPGAHQVQEDLADELLALGVAAGETVKIVVNVDAAADVVELSELNNKLTGSAVYAVDLLLRRLAHPCAVLDSLFDVTVEYTVSFNNFNENFTICAYASDNDAAAISPGDILLTCLNVNVAADKTVGNHTKVITDVEVSSADFPANNFFVKVRLDDGEAVAETNEANNALARPNAAMDPSEDGDGDGVPDCFDECPADANKTSPGTCGCGVADVDTDGDGVEDCLDQCPSDPDKLDPGFCGCGVPDADADGDNVPDCVDADPADPNVPVPQGTPGGQENPTDGSPFDVFLPIIPFVPVPVCGIGLCGSGSIVPIGLLAVGLIGLRQSVRRRRK